MSKEFLICPKCKSDHWFDIPSTTNPDDVRFRCFRCQHMVRFVKCRQCQGENWHKTKGIDKKGGQRPFYRYKCLKCGRMVGVKIYS